MLKKIMLGVVAAVLLIGAESLIGQERKDSPEARQRRRGQPEQLRRQRAEEGAVRRPAEGMQQRRQQRARREAGRGPMEATPGKPEPSRPGQYQPRLRALGRWFDELTNAYQDNDR